MTRPKQFVSAIVERTQVLAVPPASESKKNRMNSIRVNPACSGKGRRFRPPGPTFTDAGSLRGPVLWWYPIERLPESTDERTLGCQYYSSSFSNKQTSTSNTTYHQQQKPIESLCPIIRVVTSSKFIPLLRTGIYKMLPPCPEYAE